MTTQPASRLNPTVTTIAYYVAFIALGITTAATGPTLPQLANHTASSLGNLSIIFVFGSLGYLISSWVSGRMFDRLPGHRIISLALVALGVTLALIPVAPVLPILVAIIFIEGLAQGPVDVGANTLLMWVHGSKVGPYMNGLHFTFGVGALISPLVVAQVIKFTGDIYWVYWLFAIFMIPIAIWMWFLPSPSPREKAEHKPSGPIPFSIIFLIMLFFFIYVGAELGYGNWIYTYALTLGLGTVVTSAYLNSAYWGFFTLSRLAGVWISTRFTSKNIMIADFVGAIASMAFIMLFPTSPAALWVGTIAFGISIASIFPTMFTYAEERMHITGSVTGWFLVGSGLGGMFMPWMIGQLFETVGPQAMVTAVLISLIANLGIFVLITRKKLATNNTADSH